MRVTRILAVVAVVVAVLGVVRYVRQAPDRELAARFELAFGLIEVERSDFRVLDALSLSNGNCDSGSDTRHEQSADSRGALFDPAERAVVAERMAVGFETAGWQVERYVPDGSPISTALRVAAIDGDDTVISLFGEEGGVSVIVRINSCPEFVDGRSRIKVDHFPTDPEAVATPR